MLASAKQFREALKKFEDYKQLTGANQVDVRILRDNVDREIFSLEELREAEWNPLVYNQSLANSLYLLVARDFDSAEKRIPNLRQRMEGIPNVIKQAEANLQHPPKIHTETAIEQVQGAINLVRNGLDPLLEPGAANEKGHRADPGKNGAGAGRLQKMVAARFAQARGRRFPNRRGQVSQETAVRARVRFVDGRSDEARPSRASPNPKRDL